MGRPRKPDIPYVPPAPGEDARRCPDCDRAWPRRLMRHNGRLRCVNCARKYRRRYYQGASSARDANLQGNPSLGPEETEALLRRQAFSCPVCMRKLRSDHSIGTPVEAFESSGLVDVAVVDRDERTGEVRGLLCSSCVVGLAALDADMSRAERAARYLAGKELAVPSVGVKVGARRMDLRDPRLRQMVLEDEDAARAVDALIEQVVSVNRQRRRG